MTNLFDQYDELVDRLLDQGIKKKFEIAPHLDDEFIFKLKYDSISEFSNYIYQSMLLHRGDKTSINKLFPSVTSRERLDIYEKEKYERKMILNDLKFQTHINIDKFNEPTTSRRFIATNDSCMSFAQVTLDAYFFRWVFVSRSTEVNKMLPSDLYSIAYIVKNWTDWFIEYRHNKWPLGNKKEQRGIKLMIVLNNPHYYR